MATKLNGSSTCRDVAEAFPVGAAAIQGATVVITGASAGIGEETAFQFALLGARVVLACRSLDKAEKSRAGMYKRAAGKELDIICMLLDLSDMDSVMNFATDLKTRVKEHQWNLKYLVCNAGIVPAEVAASKQGFELSFATNHLGHFLLTRELLPALRASAPARVIVVSSHSHRGPVSVTAEDLLSATSVREKLVYPDYTASGFKVNTKLYGNSKLCNVLMAKKLHALETGNDVTVCSLHPGSLITTSIARNQNFLVRALFQIISPLTKNVDQGSATTMFCALAPKESVSGIYADNCQASQVSKRATDQAATVLWDVSTQLLSKL